MEHWQALDKMADLLLGAGFFTKSFSSKYVEFETSDQKFSIEIDCGSKSAKIKSADLKWSASPLVDQTDQMQVMKYSYVGDPNEKFELLQGDFYVNLKQYASSSVDRTFTVDGREAMVTLGPVLIKSKDLDQDKIAYYSFNFEITSQPETRNSSSFQQIQIRTVEGIAFNLFFSKTDLYICNTGGLSSLVTATAINNDDPHDTRKLARKPMDLYDTVTKKTRTHEFTIEGNNLILHTNGRPGLRVKMAFPYIPYMVVFRDYDQCTISVSEADKETMYCQYKGSKCKLISGYETENSFYQVTSPLGPVYLEQDKSIKTVFTAEELAQMFFKRPEMRCAALQEITASSVGFTLILKYTHPKRHVKRHYLNFTRE